ncbi:Short-chain dehydrogenase/reductase family protein [Mycena chlorophos]|uniref:Short-chain dehydrogenase/reductase family protein n=1 Tax=Mycena chlorophos TaxID=658473 RepID=A0A8H6THC8_MYCCL|nr:Short-chain dehydrogenase/reductase family protein [Mycena chlorophos]
MAALPNFTFDSTAEEVATALADNIKDKNVLITGTSLNGIGFEAARVIAKYANLVIITGYNAERLKLSEDAIKQENPSANVRRLTLDLSSLAAYAPITAYAEAKAAAVLTAAEISRRSKGRILGYSLHPGVIVTNIMDASAPVMQSIGILTPEGKPNLKDHKFKTIPQGAATTIAAAFDPRIVSTPGAYLDDSVVANEKVAPHSADPAAASAVWTATEELVGEKFEF